MKMLDIFTKKAYKVQGDKVYRAPLPPLTATLILSEISVMATSLIPPYIYSVKNLSLPYRGVFYG